MIIVDINNESNVPIVPMRPINICSVEMATTSTCIMITMYSFDSPPDISISNLNEKTITATQQTCK